MGKKDLSLKVLENLGLHPREDEEGDLLLSYQMKNIFLLLGDTDETYLSLWLPDFHEIEESETPLALSVCNKLTRELKLVKVCLDQNFKNVSATCEFYFTDEDSLAQNLKKSLAVLGVVRSVFHKELLELNV